MRIVLDSNVVFSALLWRGTPYRLIEAVRHHPGIQLYSSPALILELAEILTRPAASKRLVIIGKTANDVLLDYQEAVERVATASVQRIVLRDPDDDHVIATALAASADLIVSGDRDLLDLGSVQNIRILTAAQTIAEIEEMR